MALELIYGPVKTEIFIKYIQDTTHIKQKAGQNENGLHK